jgi:thiol-disulfide isomerase/thioredoxin
MKKILSLVIATAFVGIVGCNRAGVIDATGGAASGSTSSAGKSATVARIAHGERVDLKNYIVPGKTTIFDFTSEYCPPCRAIAPSMHKLHADRADVVVVEVDLNRPGHKGIDWHSPVAEQYGMQSIPHFKVFGPDGKLKAEGDEAYPLVTGMFQ